MRAHAFRETDRRAPGLVRRWRRVAAAAGVLLGVSHCDGKAPPAPRAEPDQQVKRLRDDMDVELEDLRGRWLAAEAALLKAKEQLRSQRTELDATALRLGDHMSGLEVRLAGCEARLQPLEVGAVTRAVPLPVEDRAARAFEEIECLRRRGVEEGYDEIRGRWGFTTAEAWSDAWQSAVRKDGFERDVRARIDRLCP